MMATAEFPPLVIGDLTIRTPIVQGGMGVAISLGGLASAVANEGGVGVIATAGICYAERDRVTNFRESNIRALRREIQNARARTQGVLGVNIMAALSNYEDLARTAMEEGIDVIFSGAGLPMNLPAYRTEGVRTKLVPIVSSGRAAAIVARRWKERFDSLPDAFVVEGPLAGGHLGFKAEQLDDPKFALEHLVAEVLVVTREIEKTHGVHIPVIAGGGVYTGADIRRTLALGAEGVQMATRFVTTNECDASEAFKQSYIDAKEEDLMIIKSPVGLPGRAIRNQFLDDVSRGEKKPFACPFHCIVTCDVVNSPYCIAQALLNARRGNLENGFAFAGANAWRATKVVSVHELVETLRQEYAESEPAA
jgi:nitronate monooxygenase